MPEYQTERPYLKCNAPNKPAN